MSSLPLNMQIDPGAGLKLGRAAGFAYLVMVVTTSFWYGAMTNFRGQGDAALLSHIGDHRLLFELSILAGAFGFVAYLANAALLYRRFSREAGVAVSLLFTFVVASVPLSLMAISRQMELLPLLDAAGVPAQALQTQVTLLLSSHDILMRLSSFFWGLWLLPLAWLAYRGGGSGKPVGALLTLGGLGYVSAFIRPLFSSAATVAPWVQGAFLILGVLSVLGELTAILWLLLAADRPPKSVQRSPAPVA